MQRNEETTVDLNERDYIRGRYTFDLQGVL